LREQQVSFHLDLRQCAVAKKPVLWWGYRTSGSWISGVAFAVVVITIVMVIVIVIIVASTTAMFAFIVIIIADKNERQSLVSIVENCCNGLSDRAVRCAHGAPGRDAYSSC
jgi:hypothetical protein